MKKDKKTESEVLRDQAEERLHKGSFKSDSSLAEYENLKLIHELEVHQIELELQNDELQRAKADSEIAKDRYTTLYDFAPSGYISLSKLGNITELNFTSAKMLGKERSKLINSRFGFFISPDSRSNFKQFFDKAFESKNQKICEVSLIKDDEPPTHVLLTGIVNEGEEFCKITMVDITESKQAHEYIEFLAKFPSENPNPVLRIAKNGDLLYVNEAGLRLLPDWDLQVGKPTVPILCKTVLKVLIDGKIQTLDIKHGTRLYAFVATPIHDEDYVNVYATDITERNQAQIELSQQKALFESIFTCIPDGIVYVNTDREIVRINSAFSSIFGFTIDDLAGKKTSFFYESIEEYERQGQIRFNLTAEENLLPYEVSYRKKDGSVFPGETLGTVVKSAGNQPLGYIGVIRDISERKQTENSLKESNQMITGIINTIPTRVFWKDTNLVYLGCNEIFAQDAGFSKPEELIGKDDFQMGWAENAEKYRADDLNVILNGTPKYLMEEQQITPDGKTITLLTSKIPLKNSYGKIYGILGTYIDITEREEVKKDKEILQAQLTQAQKMESIGRLAGGVAHDFNNMLGVILGHAEMVLDELEATSPIYTDIEEISKAAQRSADLTRQLLAFARKQTVTPEVLDLNSTLEGMLKMLRRMIGEAIELIWLPDKNLYSVKMDKSQIDQLLANLCVNARDSIANIGKVTIETSNAAFDENYCSEHSDFMPGEFVKLTISDTGCGMDEETLEQVFEPFFTTKEVGKGTGLGLSTIYGIVKQNKGFITVHSELNQGTTFNLYLPRYIGKNKQLNKNDKSTLEKCDNETILVVEDELVILKMITRMLEKLGYKVVPANTTSEAIRLADEYPTQIHMLITDVVMPEMNGRDLAKNILTMHPNIKRLFMSGYTADIIAQQGVLDKGVNFIQKPFSLKALSTKVHEIMTND